MREKIKKFIIQRFLFGKGAVGDKEWLFEKNIVDSFGIMELVAFIEKEFKVTINQAEINVKNFESVDKICALVEAKKKK